MDGIKLEEGGDGGRLLSKLDPFFFLKALIEGAVKTEAAQYFPTKNADPLLR